MGYYEVDCQICGVAFNISRFRTAGEPAEAAWRTYDNHALPFVDEYERLSQASCVEEGCYFLRRRPTHEIGYERGYLPEDGTEERWPPEGSRLADLTIDDDPSNNGVVIPMASGPVVFEEHADGIPYERGRAVFEHIAGPECVQLLGYSGARISAEAMRGCNTYQCLAAKPLGWSPAPDDEPFEATGDFFLTGLCDKMCHSDQSSNRVYPPRHDYELPQAYNQCLPYGGEDGEPSSMPFHPTCLEIFKRASLDRYGVIDLHGLGSWYRVGDGLEWYDFPRDEAVDSARDGCWLHNPGDEYLVANPCSITELDAMISKTRVGNTSADPQVRDHRGSAGGKPSPSRDIFQRLPYDVQCNIAALIGFRDLTNLRLVSSTFRDLHPSVYHEMVLREMPWFYEAWSSLPISPWATTTEKKLRAGELAQGIAMKPLSRDEADWESLGFKLDRAGDAVPGLRNRRRIWGDCQVIMDQVDSFRAEGKIEDGKTG